MNNTTPLCDQNRTIEWYSKRQREHHKYFLRSRRRISTIEDTPQRVDWGSSVMEIQDNHHQRNQRQDLIVVEILAAFLSVS